MIDVSFSFHHASCVIPVQSSVKSMSDHKEILPGSEISENWWQEEHTTVENQPQQVSSDSCRHGEKWTLK